MFRHYCVIFRELLVSDNLHNYVNSVLVIHT